jgi:RNA-binding protein NOB1
MTAWSGGVSVEEESSENEGSSARGDSSACDSSGEEVDGEAGVEPALVSIITADFAMQNVILQMGLQLISPDGRQIRKINRWVLRCSACFKVTKVGFRICLR